MFYVSSLKNDLIGITDTSDSVEEFLSNRQVVQLMESKKADIFGVLVYNHIAECTVLSINKSPDKTKLVGLLEGWRKPHNQWTGVPVEDYLAEMKVGTVIEVEYVATSDGDRREFSGKTTIKKLSYDEWLFEDDGNTVSGRKGDSRFAAWGLEVACVYSKPKRIRVI